MTTIFIASVVLLGYGQTPPPPLPSNLEHGRVALLTNYKLLEGEIQRDGEFYRIQRTVGETRLPATRVLFLGPDRASVYEYLKRKAQLRDPDERLRLARWCLSHGLRRQALSEAQAALELRPSDVEARQMAGVLSRAGGTAVPPQAAMPPPHLNELLEKVGDPMPYNTASFELFVTRVQPTLMNTCARCHVGTQAGNFRLVRVPRDARSVRGTHYNLQATLSQIDQEQPDQSPLLQYAVTLHGNASEPPIRDRQSPPFRWLKLWAHRALAAAAKTASKPAENEGESIFRTAVPVVPSVESPVIVSFPPTPTAVSKPTPMQVQTNPRPSAVPSREASKTTVVPANPLPPVVPTKPKVAPAPLPPVVPTKPKVAPAPVPPVIPAKPTDPFDPDQFNRKGSGGN